LKNEENIMSEKSSYVVAEPPFFASLFTETKWAPWLWLVVRVYLGYEWFMAGYEKAIGKGWLDGGAALKGFWTGIVKVSGNGHDPISYDWYRAFIQMLLNANAQTWFAPLVVVGEMLIGIALILGVFTWFAALMGGFLNWNFTMSGSGSVNGMYLVLSCLLILAWKIAGYYGLDRWTLKFVPWQLGAQVEKPVVKGALPTEG
jgi:thiosulfate dehydrogenase [quinone] large subunit